jgi:hypothetical protein
MSIIEIILLAVTIGANVIMDAIMSNDVFAKYGLWYSRDGWTIKYDLKVWLNQYLPLWLSKFLAYDVLVVFTELYKVAKTVMILAFMFLAFGFTWKAVLTYFVWGLLFSFSFGRLRLFYH